jgi:hypothetical protein
VRDVAEAASQIDHTTQMKVNAHSAIQFCVCQGCKNLQHPEMLAQRPSVPVQRPEGSGAKP